MCVCVCVCVSVFGLIVESHMNHLGLLDTKAILTELWWN